MAEREDIIPAGLEWQYTDVGFSPAVRVGDIVYVAGVIGMREDRTVDNDPETQFAQAFSNLAHVLEAAGCSLSDVVEMTSFHIGLREHVSIFMAAKQAAMAGPPHPAWTAVEVAELGLPGALVEIATTAHRRS